MLLSRTDDESAGARPQVPKSPSEDARACKPVRMPKYAALRDELAQQIFSGDIPFGAKLPSETALGTRFDVSRVTVRHALEALREVGLVESRQGRGHFARRVRIGLELDRLVGLTETLEPSGIRIGAQVLSLKPVNGRPKLRAELNLSADDRPMRLIRLRQIGNRPVCLETRYLTPKHGRRLSDMELTDADMYAIYEGEFGIELGYAQVSVDHIGASPAVAKLLQLPKGAPLMRMRHLVFDDGARPFELCERLCLPRLFTLSVRAGRG